MKYTKQALLDEIDQEGFDYTFVSGINYRKIEDAAIKDAAHAYITARNELAELLGLRGLV